MKKQKVFKISLFGQKVDQKNFWKNYPSPRHVRWKISAHIDGGPSGGTSMRRPRSISGKQHKILIKGEATLRPTKCAR